MTPISVVIPAYNEAQAIGEVLKKIEEQIGGRPHEIIVVDDGSTDATKVLSKTAGATVLSNATNLGYGFSLKRGLRAAHYECIVIMDADGTYPAHMIDSLVNEFDKGFDMVVGARQGKSYAPTWTKKIARKIFQWMSEFVVGHRIPDINSGFRVLRRSAILPVLDDLSNGFSFTTSSTLVLFLKHQAVTYLPISYETRQGASKVRYFRDTLRTLQIMVEITAKYNPIKLFLLMSLLPFLFGSFFLGWLIISLGFFAAMFKRT